MAQNLYDIWAFNRYMKSIHLLLPKHQHDWLLSQSTNRGSISKAAVVRQLIAAAMQEQSKA